ncbi:MAG: Holliday junction DNA helicase RuvB C-terminal domain-containing protein [Frisingicoccus sp.]
MSQIILRSADVFKMQMDEAGAMELARRSRGTPRLANRLLKRFGITPRSNMTDGDGDVAREVLDILEVDRYGLDSVDRNILWTMIEKFGGGPVGLDTLAASIGEDAGTLEDVYEPYLLQNGFLQRTPRGRMVTPAAYRHLGLPVGEK